MVLTFDPELVEQIEANGGDPKSAVEQVQALLSELTGNTGDAVIHVTSFTPPAEQMVVTPRYGHVADDMAEQFQGGKPDAAGKWDENI